MTTRRSTFLVSIGAAVLFLTLASGSEAQEPADIDRGEIQTVLDSYEQALNASDVDAVLALYADDGVFMPSSAPPAAGIESVRAAYEYVFTTIKLNIAFTVEEIVADGSIGFARSGSK